MPERFTAVLKIVKVTGEYTGSGTQRSLNEKDIELLSTTVRAKTLEGVVNLSKAHLDLVEDYTA